MAGRLSRDLRRPEVLEVIAESFETKERCVLFVHAEHRILRASTENVVAMFDLLENAL